MVEAVKSARPAGGEARPLSTGPLGTRGRRGSECPAECQDRRCLVEEVLVPGERSWRERARRLREGIDLPDELLAELNDLAGEHPEHSTT